MDELSYQLDLSDSFDSGNGSEEDEEEEDRVEDGDETTATEAENNIANIGDIHVEICEICSAVVCKDVEGCFQRCAQLILSSRSSLRRLRKICYNTRSRLSKANDDLAQKRHLTSQLEST